MAVRRSDVSTHTRRCEGALLFLHLTNTSIKELFVTTMSPFWGLFGFWYFTLFFLRKGIKENKWV